MIIHASEYTKSSFCNPSHFILHDSTLNISEKLTADTIILPHQYKSYFGEKIQTYPSFHIPQSPTLPYAYSYNINIIFTPDKKYFFLNGESTLQQEIVDPPSNDGSETTPSS